MVAWTQHDTHFYGTNAVQDAPREACVPHTDASTVTINVCFSVDDATEGGEIVFQHLDGRDSVQHAFHVAKRWCTTVGKATA